MQRHKQDTIQRRKVSTEKDTLTQKPVYLEAYSLPQRPRASEKYTDVRTLGVNGQNGGNDCLPGLLLWTPSRLPSSGNTCSKVSSQSLEGNLLSNISPCLLLPVTSELKSYPEDSRKVMMCLIPIQRIQQGHKFRSTFLQISHFLVSWGGGGRGGRRRANLNILEWV